MNKPVRNKQKNTIQPKPAAREPQNNKTPGLKLFYIIIAIFAIALYAQTTGFDFALDDSMMITQNGFTVQGISAIPEIFSRDAFTGFYGDDENLIAGGRYRPFTHAMFAAEYEIFGNSPLTGHLINILLYALLGIIIFKTLTMLFSGLPGKNPWISFIPFTATLLFLAHPLHTEVVANIKGRDEIISMGGSMLALLFSMKFIVNNKIKYLVLSFISFLIALFSKENAVTFLAVVPLALYFFTSARRKDYVVTLIPLFAAFVIFIVARYQALGFWMTGDKVETEILNNPFINSSRADEIATVLFTWLLYFKLLIFPHPLTHDYYPWHINIMKFSDPSVIVAIIVTLALLVIAVRLFRRKHFVSFGILFFAATFSIQSNLLFNLGTFMNERFVFASLLGFCIIAAGFLSKFSLKHSRNMKILFIAVLALYSVKTISRSAAWKDNFTLFTTDVKTSVNSAKCNTSAAEVLIARGKTIENKAEAAKLFSRALKHLQHSIELHPAYFASYDLAGMASYYLDNFDASYKYYRACLEMMPSSNRAVENIFLVSTAAFSSGRQAEGIEMMKWLNERVPDSLSYKVEYASMLERTGDVDGAIRYLSEMTVQYPEYALAWGKLGEIYTMKKQEFSRAEPLLLKAYQLNPNDVTVNDMLGIVSLMLQKFDQSLKHYQLALDLDPNQARLHTSIAQTYQLMGNAEMAQFHFQKAAELEQKNSDNPINL